MKEQIDSVVLLHDGPRLWLVEDEDGLFRAFRHRLPDDFTFDNAGPDWEGVFWFLPDEIRAEVKVTWPIGIVPSGSGGRPARLFSFDTQLPEMVPAPGGPLGRVVEARLGRANEYAWEGRIADSETLLALFAVAHARVKNGGRGKGQ